MTTLRTLLTLGVMLAITGVPAGAETYTFNETDGVWETAGNWIPDEGPPGANDTAVIPINKTCRVEDDDQAAKIIQVTGTLAIKGRKLTLGSSSAATTSTVNGTVYFEKVSGRDAVLFVSDKWVTINGSGTLTGRKADGASREGVLDTYNWYPTAGFKFGAEMTVIGTFFIDTSLELLRSGNDFARVAVDSSLDTVTLGRNPTSEDTRFSGQGQFDISAGDMQVKAVGFTNPTPEWKISESGLINLTDVGAPHISPFVRLHVPITMTGGTLYVDDDLETTATCKFHGGKIWVEENNVAEFRWE